MLEGTSQHNFGGTTNAMGSVPEMGGYGVSGYGTGELMKLVNL